MLASSRILKVSVQKIHDSGFVFLWLHGSKTEMAGFFNYE
jgi:hypothetical protein